MNWAYQKDNYPAAIVEYTLIEKDHLGDWSPERDCC